MTFMRNNVRNSLEGQTLDLLEDRGRIEFSF